MGTVRKWWPQIAAYGVLVLLVPCVQMWHMPLAVTLGASVVLVVAAWWAMPRSATCDMCGVDSEAAGVPYWRLGRNGDRLLGAAGWSDDEGYLTCASCVREAAGGLDDAARAVLLHIWRTGGLCWSADDAQTGKLVWARMLYDADPSRLPGTQWFEVSPLGVRVAELLTAGRPASGCER